MAVGYNVTRSVLELVTAPERDGNILILHAMTPPSKEDASRTRLTKVMDMHANQNKDTNASATEDRMEAWAQRFEHGEWPEGKTIRLDSLDPVAIAAHCAEIERERHSL